MTQHQKLALYLINQGEVHCPVIQHIDC